MAKLFLIRQNSLQEIPLNEEVSIGRAESNVVCLDGDAVSRFHAVICRRGAEIIVRDLNSKNGVLVNGTKVAESPLKSGDEVRVGSYTFLFDPPTPRAPESARAIGDARGVASAGLAEADSPYPAMPAAAREEITPTRPIALAQDASDSGVFIPIKDVHKGLEDLKGVSAQLFIRDVLSLHRDMISSAECIAEEDEEIVFNRCLGGIVEALRPDRAAIVMKDAAGNLQLGAVFPGDTELLINRVVLRSALKHAQAVICNDVQKSAHFHRSRAVFRENIGSLAAFPVMRGRTPGGIIYADAIGRTEVFRSCQLHLLHLAASQLQRDLRLLEARAKVPADAAERADGEEMRLIAELKASYISASKRRSRKIAAMAALAQKGAISAASAIVDHLSDRDPLIASAAYSALVGLGSDTAAAGMLPQFYDTLLRGLESVNSDKRMKAAAVLLKLDPRRPVLRAKLEELAASPSCPLPAKATISRLLEKGPEPIFGGGTEHSDATWVAHPQEFRPKRADVVAQDLEKKRQHFQARQEWLRNGKRGPEPGARE